MSERKVLNKYYPPDFDPSKIPRVERSKNVQFTVRTMVPCNMKCCTCSEYIAKARKLNAIHEVVKNMSYLGIKIYRFYIKCPRCLAEISYRTDPENTDYVIEAGAHRNFQALKLAEEQAAKKEKEAQEEIESNPMLLLENRTKQSQYEMEVLESLGYLKELNDCHADMNIASMTDKYEQRRILKDEERKLEEHKEAMIALGYTLVGDRWVKKLKKTEVEDNSFVKNVKRKAPFPLPNSVKKAKKSPLASMIKIRQKTEDSIPVIKDEPLESEPQESATNQLTQAENEQKPTTSALSSLCAYSDSEDSS